MVSVSRHGLVIRQSPTGHMTFQTGCGGEGTEMPRYKKIEPNRLTELGRSGQSRDEIRDQLIDMIKNENAVPLHWLNDVTRNVALSLADNGKARVETDQGGLRYLSRRGFF